MENIELSDEIQKIRERTFNPEFKELVSKVLNKTLDTIDNHDSLLYSLHKLYYEVLSSSFNDSITFVKPQELCENTLQFLGEDILKKLQSLRFAQALIFQYDFKQNYFGILTNSFADNLLRDFFLTLSDDIYRQIINNPDGVVIDIASLKNDKQYEKRLKLLEDQQYLIWAFSTHPLVKKLLIDLNLPFPQAIEIFCPVIFVKVHDTFAVDKKILDEFYWNCITTIFSLIELSLAINKGSVFLGSNYFHEVFKVFENYYYISRSNECVKYVVIKSKHEDQYIYCLFRYLSNKLNKFKSYSCINYRPMIGLIVLFLYEENDNIKNVIKTISSLFGDSIKIGQVDRSEIKNAVNLYKYIIDL